MGPYESPDPYEAEQQAQLGKEFPGVDVLYLLGGYIAVPKGTWVVAGMSLDGLREKLRGARGAG